MQTLTWYRHRLGRMGPAEVVARIARTLSVPGDVLRARTAPAVRRPAAAAPVRAVLQGGGRMDARCGAEVEPRVDPGIEPATYIEAAERVAAGELIVFGRVFRVGAVPDWNRDPKSGTRAPLELGRALDYRDERKVGDIKYLWEPNRHLHLVTLAQAYRLTGEARYLDVLRRHIVSWLDQCPPLRGPNWASSLEAGIRLINWSLVWELAGGDQGPLFVEETGRGLRRAWLQSIYHHLAFIAANPSRYSSANNHLIGEAAGLYVGALAWPLWAACPDWVERAQAILEEQCRAQIAPDGVHREQAFAYAQFVFDFLLLAALAGRAHGREFSAGYWRRLEKTVEFVAAVMDVAGNVPQVGDADDGYVVRLSQERRFCPFRSLLATGAVLFERPEFKAKSGGLDDKTRWLFGPEAAHAYAALPATRVPLPLPRTFPEGGYYVLGADLDTPEEVRLLVDAGPLGYLSLAAHGHADALSILLSVRGKEVLVDAGTYAYHTQPEWRAYFKGTAAHNTVCVDAQDQSVSGGNFMWLRHAGAECLEWHSNAREDRLIAAHDGYRRLPDPVVHRRAVRLLKAERRIVVADMLFCTGVHAATRWWHFAEGCTVRLGAGGRVEVRCGDVQVVLTPEGPVEAELLRGAPTPPGGWVSRHYDDKRPAASVAWVCEVTGSVALRTQITYT